ncbi:glycosyltransferase family 4 protein [Phormidium tenue FACHB-886]|nr:glycosyltransferase family 4 protein [Phormidium tenue FACHB-886]
MHIAITVDQFNQLGGTPRVAVQLAHGYKALGHDVTVFTTEWDRAYEAQFAFEKIYAPNKPAWLQTLTLPDAMARRLASSKFDFVHGHGNSTSTCDLLTFHTVHAAWLDISILEEKSFSWRRLAKRVYPFHRATIAMQGQIARKHRGVFQACSRAVRQEAIQYYGVDPDRIWAVPWGVDLETFRPDPAMRAKRRQEWGFTESTPVLLMVANEFHRKGLAQILMAMAELGNPEVKLVTVGKADPTPYLPLVQKLGLEKQVLFLGLRPVASYYQAADLFIMPTTYEGWALVIGESLASGLPVVTSKFAGSSDLIEPGKNGLLLQDPRDVNELAQALNTALKPQMLQAMAAAARPSVMHNTWLEASRQLLALGTKIA